MGYTRLQVRIIRRRIEMATNMIAEILASGDEICSGAILDSNSAHIAQKLEKAGIKVVRHSCVGDDINTIAGILKEIGGRADIVVVTGGLGLTADDLTAEAAANAAGVELQTMLPKGAESLCNLVGTASGFFMKIGRCSAFFMPGVPSEMRRMLSDTVLPRIKKLQGNSRKFRQVKEISLFGLTESAISERITDLKVKFPEIKPGICVRFPEVHIKLYANGENKKNLNELLKNACKWVLKKIGKSAFSVDGDSMETVVGNLLRREKSTIAVAESCTGGLISHWLTNVPGSSYYFFFSGVTYSNKAKIKVLDVLPATLKRYGAVHEETAKEMAEGARRIAGATYGLSTTGIAGPSGGTTYKPVGTVCIGLATPYGTKSHRFNFAFDDRSMNKKIFAMTALDLLRRELLGNVDEIRNVDEIISGS